MNNDNTAAGSFRYAFLVPRDVTEEQLKKDVEAAWKAGLQSEAWLRNANPPDDQPFKITAEMGADPLTAAVLITLATGGAQLTVKIANDVWDKIILPWLMRKYGSDAVQKK